MTVTPIRLRHVLALLAAALPAVSSSPAPAHAAPKDEEKPLVFLPGECLGTACEEVRLILGEKDGCVVAVNTGRTMSSVRYHEDGSPIEVPPPPDSLLPSSKRAAQAGDGPPLEPVDQYPDVLGPKGRLTLRGPSGGCLRPEPNRRIHYVALKEKVSPERRIARMTATGRWVELDWETNKPIAYAQPPKSEEDYEPEIAQMWKEEHPVQLKGVCDDASTLERKIRRLGFYIFREERMYSRNQRMLHERDNMIRKLEFQIAMLEFRTPADSPDRATKICPTRGESVAEYRARTGDDGRKSKRAEQAGRASRDTSGDRVAQLAPAEEETKPDRLARREPVERELDERQVRLALAEATQLLRDRKFEEAVARLEPLIRDRPAHVAARKLRGYAYRLLNDDRSAIFDFNIAISEAPDDIETRELRALAYFARKDCASSVRDWTRITELDPDRANAWLYRGACRFRLREFENAVSDLDQAIRLVEGRGDAPAVKMQYDARIQRAKAAFELKHFDAAAADLGRAVEMNPKDPWLHYFRGNSLAFAGRYEAALAEANEALRLKPDYPEARKLVAGVESYLKKKAD